MPARLHVSSVVVVVASPGAVVQPPLPIGQCPRRVDSADLVSSWAPVAEELEQAVFQRPPSLVSCMGDKDLPVCNEDAGGVGEVDLDRSTWDGAVKLLTVV